MIGWLRRLGRRFGALGDRGEGVAARWLKRRGYRILRRNLRVGRDEADLLALDPDGDTLVIVEVKTRADPAAWPEEAIDYDKRFKLARLAGRLAARPQFRDRAFRFDVVAVTWPPDAQPQLRHYENAFESP